MTTAPVYEVLDAALDRLAPYGIALGNGNFNHAPMVAEALCALGRPDEVLPWIERYRPRLLPRADEGEPIDPVQWRGELGRRERFSAWSGFFAAALEAADWPEVLDCWAARLAPGLSGAATHGVIRVGHAARALAAAETAPRRRELADALASWAASYAELPSIDGGGGNPSLRLPPHEALAAVPVVPPERRQPGNIASALARLAELPEFASVIDRVDLDGDIAERLAELTDLFARAYLANARSIPTVIAFIHGVTSLAALDNIAPHLRAPAAATLRQLVRYGWQAGCALYACYGGALPYLRELEPGIDGFDALVDRAVANGDEHAIKFAEACRRCDLAAPSPVYSACVSHALSVIVR